MSNFQVIAANISRAITDESLTHGVNKGGKAATGQFTAQSNDI